MNQLKEMHHWITRNVLIIRMLQILFTNDVTFPKRLGGKTFLSSLVCVNHMNSCITLGFRGKKKQSKEESKRKTIYVASCLLLSRPPNSEQLDEKRTHYDLLLLPVTLPLLFEPSTAPKLHGLWLEALEEG